jgi:hypothetical protein
MVSATPVYVAVQSPRTFQQYADYHSDDGEQPAELPNQRPGNPLFSLPAFPIYPEDRYSNNFTLPFLVREADFTMLYRDMEWNDWELPMTLVLMFMKEGTYDVCIIVESYRRYN